MKLKPCPFCGEELPQLYETDHAGWAVFCQGCRLEVVSELDRHELIDAWNQRADAE